MVRSNNKQQKRKLRFHERVQFKTIRHVAEFSDDEIRNGWYDKDDFNRMSDNVSDIAKLIADGKTSLNGEELCTRGLEHIVEEELADYRAEKMINSIDAVLDEQEEQWDEGKEQPELIAELYAEYAKPLLREAHLIGLKDAEEGYKSWDDLFDQKAYQKFVEQSSESPPFDGLDDAAKTKKRKKVKKLDDSVQKRQHESERMKQNIVSSNTASENENLGPSKIKVKKNKVKKSDVMSKTKKDSCVVQKEMKDLSLSSSSLESSTSQSSTSLMKNQNSTRSIHSCTLKDASAHSISEDFDTKETDPTTKRNSMERKPKENLPLQTKDEGQNEENANSMLPKKQGKRNSRRSLSDRKNGTELSPFFFRRDGTLAFRKPDVEKLKREQRKKRKSFVETSLSKFLQCDEEEDILAGILSGVVK